MGIFILLSSLILTAFSVYLFTSILLKQNKDAEALAWAEGDEPETSGHPLIEFSRPLVHNFTLSHVQRIKREKYRAKIEYKILTAGLAKEINVNEFLGLQLLWGVAFPVLFTVFNFALQFGFPWFSAFIISGIGFYFPHAYCNSCKKKRDISIRDDLPMFVDILALSTEAGLDLMGAIQRITDKALKSSVLAQEFLIVLKDVKLGQTRKEALTSLDKRLDLPEIKSIVAVVRDADETGASIADALKAKTKQMRFERFAKAEELGAKASQKILIPMMMFIIPAVFIVVFAPAAFQFMGGN
ncbi:MAG: type II secretion system F family protein [Bdellovibrionales bacterium]|nr:type II secretion system F family protein [Bdellovibrionales bacterium]